MNRPNWVSEPQSKKVNVTAGRHCTVEERVINMEIMMEKLTCIVEKIGHDIHRFNKDLLHRMDVNQNQTNEHLKCLASQFDQPFFKIGCLH